jgi:hypothetical protein
MASNRSHESRPALITIRYEPAPEVGALARSPHCSPSASQKREVQEYNSVCRSKPNIDSVAGTKIAIHNPLFFRNQLLLNNYPLIARHCSEP